MYCHMVYLFITHLIKTRSDTEPMRIYLTESSQIDPMTFTYLFIFNTGIIYIYKKKTGQDCFLSFISKSDSRLGKYFIVLTQNTTLIGWTLNVIMPVWTTCFFGRRKIGFKWNDVMGHWPKTGVAVGSEYNSP